MGEKIPVCKPDGSKSNVEEKDVIINDSLGTVTVADSSGSEEEKETGDAKKNNRPTRED